MSHSNPEYEPKYKEARAAFEGGDLREASEKLMMLLRDILAKILVTEHVRLFKREDYTKAREDLAKETVQEGDEDLETLCAIFDQADIFTACKSAHLKSNAVLLNSFNYVKLHDLLVSTMDGLLDEYVRRLAIQQVLSAIVCILAALDELEVKGIHFIVNTSELLRLAQEADRTQKQTETINDYISYITEEHRVRGRAKKVFEWIKVRGMLINTGDGSRNVSFKCTTFVNILSQIYNATLETCKPASKDQTIDEVASGVLRVAGYDSGSNFGRTLHDLFQRDEIAKSLDEKIAQWCAFDSDVGFGMFTANKVKLDGSNFKVSITLSDNFMVVEKDAEDINLCTFMSGYIQGVLERITRLPMSVEHPLLQCEQFNPEIGGCTFVACTDSVRLKRIMSLIKARSAENKSRRGIPQETDDTLKEDIRRVPKSR